MMEGLFFISSKYRVTKGFKFHARPQTGANSCLPPFSQYPVFVNPKSGGIGGFDCTFVKPLNAGDLHDFLKSP